MDNIKVEIITIGDELLIGQIVDTNSSWMGAELAKHNFSVQKIISVSDDFSSIYNAFKEALFSADIVLVTGGLGPTKDDITKTVVCDFFETKLVEDTSVRKNIESIFSNKKMILNELTFQQAYVPESAVVIQNKAGTAPAIWMEKDGKVLISMPGVPIEMKWLMNNEIIPRMQKSYLTSSIIHKTILVHGYGESLLAIKLTEWENNLPSFIKLAYLPTPGIVKLRLSGKLSDEKKLKRVIDEQVQLLYDILDRAIVGEDDLPFEQIIGNLLKKKNMQLATAESCTGGNIAHLITSIPGSSSYFKGSVVAYSNEIKENVLGLSPEILFDYGAVSQPVVEQMSQSVLKMFDADVAVAVSGIAGPDGGTKEKPVGTVWIAACRKNKIISKEFHFTKFRDINITIASISALAMIKEIIED